MLRPCKKYSITYIQLENKMTNEKKKKKKSNTNEKMDNKQCLSDTTPAVNKEN